MLKGAGSLFRTLHSPVLHKIHSSGYLLTYRTHDSMSARKAHNTGRNHISNVRDYFANLGRDGHTVIDSIVNGDAGGGRVQMFAAPSMRLGAGFMNPIASAPGGECQGGRQTARRMRSLHEYKLTTRLHRSHATRSPTFLPTSPTIPTTSRRGRTTTIRRSTTTVPSTRRRRWPPFPSSCWRTSPYFPASAGPPAARQPRRPPR